MVRNYHCQPINEFAMIACLQISSSVRKDSRFRYKNASKFQLAISCGGGAAVKSVLIRWQEGVGERRGRGSENEANDALVTFIMSWCLGCAERGAAGRGPRLLILTATIAVTLYTPAPAAC